MSPHTLSRGFTCHVFVKACQKQAAPEIRQDTKMVPRRPKSLFMGSVSQQPAKAQQIYGAAMKGELQHLVQREAQKGEEATNR